MATLPAAMADSAARQAAAEMRATLIIDADSRGGGDYLYDPFPGVSNDTTRAVFVANNTEIVAEYSQYFGSVYDFFHYEVKLWDITGKDYSGSPADIQTHIVSTPANSTTTISLYSSSLYVETLRNTTSISVTKGRQYFLWLDKWGGSLDFSGMIHEPFQSGYEANLYSEDRQIAIDGYTLGGRALTVFAAFWALLEIGSFYRARADEKRYAKKTPPLNQGAKEIPLLDPEMKDNIAPSICPFCGEGVQKNQFKCTRCGATLL